MSDVKERLKLVKGNKYRVLKEGADLRWYESSGPWSWRGKHKKLDVGDEITYLGRWDGIGSDPIPVDNFDAGDAKGEFWPNDWGWVEHGYLEEIEDGA